MLDLHTHVATLTDRVQHLETHKAVEHSEVAHELREINTRLHKLELFKGQAIAILLVASAVPQILGAILPLIERLTQ